MCARRSPCDRVTEREELVGRFRTVSRLPQYFTTAIFTGAVVLDLYMVGEDAIVLLQCFDYIQSNFSGDVSSGGYLTLNSKGGKSSCRVP